MWSHGGRLVDSAIGPAIRGAETAAALAYAQEIYPTLVPGTAGWNDASNDEAFLAGDVSLTNNAPVSIYGKTPRRQDGDHRRHRSCQFPGGPVGVPADPPPLSAHGLRLYEVSGCGPGIHHLHDGSRRSMPCRAPRALDRLHHADTEGLGPAAVWTSDPETALFESCSARARSIAYAARSATSQPRPRRFRRRRHVRREW